MNNKSKLVKENYRLINARGQEQMIKQYYMWQLNEEHKDHFCVDPVAPGKEDFDEEAWSAFKENFTSQTLLRSFLFMLQDQTTDDCLGWIILTNYNFRNYTAELSYYFPPENRGKGLGSKR